jgi:hypothetical protein
MSINIEKYARLWNGSEEGWVLLKIPHSPGRYSIFNRKSSVFLRINNGDLNALLCERMRNAGCDILDDLPVDMPEIVAERATDGRVVLGPNGPKKV